MGAVLSYSIAAGLIMLALYIVYKWLLATENQPRFNRLTLLAIYGISFALPLTPRFHLSIGGLKSPVLETIKAGLPEVSLMPADESAISIYTLILYCYLAGALVAFICTLATMSTLIRLVRDGRKEKHGDYTIVYIDREDIAPFSWGRYIVMTKQEDPVCSRMIEVHESAHIRAGHFFDLIISQLTCIFLWYNPVSWLTQTELKAVHEYEADENVLKSGCNAREYQLLLIKKAVGHRFPSLANSLNHSKLKKRITMMYSKKTSAARKTRVLALVPAAALGLVLLSVPTLSEAMASASTANMSISSVGESKVTTNSAVEQPAADGNVVSKPDKMPEFMGGIDGLMTFLIKEVKYPEDAKAANIGGKVLVLFTITKDGAVSDVRVNDAVSPSLDAEAIRVVKATSGKWIPGEVNGEKVSVTYALPITFKPE